MTDNLFLQEVVHESEMTDEIFYKHYLLRHDDTVRPFTYPCEATRVTRVFHNIMHRTHPLDFDHQHEDAE